MPGDLLTISLGARFYGLDERPLHQDESQLAAHAWRLYAGKGYQYDPSNRLMHGPVLFYMDSLIFFIFGVSEFTVRLGQALCGTALVALLYSLRRHIGRAGVLGPVSRRRVAPDQPHTCGRGAALDMRCEACFACKSIMDIIPFPPVFCKETEFAIQTTAYKQRTGTPPRK